MKTVLILMDAFRHDYIESDNTPFLWKCAQDGEYYTRVKQSLGFCERSEILTGLKGNESGFFTAIGFDPKNSPYASIKYLKQLQALEGVIIFFLKIFPNHISGKIQKKIRNLIFNIFFKKSGIKMNSYSIPYSWLPYFALTEDRIDHRNREAFSVPSILSLLDDAGKKYFYDTFSALGFNSKYGSDEDRFEAVIREAKTNPKDFYLIYISAPDAYGHVYGPESSLFKKKLHKLDNDLFDFVQRLEGIDSGHNYVFLGDHGMVTVTHNLNAEKEIQLLLQSAELIKGKDVIYFLDSTMIRIWALTDKAREALPTILGGSDAINKYGEWMNKENAIRYHVPWPDRRYGDYLWVANSGCVVFPDFFHRLSSNKGMHGYNPELPDCQGMCIKWGEGVPADQRTSIPLSGIFKLLKDSLEL